MTEKKKVDLLINNTEFSLRVYLTQLWEKYQLRIIIKTVKTL